MLTGTPLDLTPFGPLLSLLGLAYWLLAISSAGLALWLPKHWAVKLGAASLVVLVFATPFLRHGTTAAQHPSRSADRLAEAMSTFADRCKSAGERILRTVDEVDGVVWLRWREQISNADNFADQWKLNDPFGQDCGGEDCIARLLRVTKGRELSPDIAKRHSVGYRFVESVDPADGLRYRYTASIRVTHQRTPEQLEQYKRNTGTDPGLNVIGYAVDRQPIKQSGARYGITWADISTREDREYWIAGGSLKIIDLQSDELIAERKGYMIDRGQGSQAGFRSPWLFAVQTACPEFSQDLNESRRGRTLDETLRFAVKVLKPRKGD